MATIQQLSHSMINKIAAGEVIERPGSVVKELVENSVDAGADRIDISVEKGGTELIRIVDNGCGIASKQLVLALSPHATSKVTETDDLFKIRTFGFRGEALASIAEISQLLLRTRTADSTEGAEIRSDGGNFTEPIPCGVPVGTTMEIANLFFNTPVRRKYMKSIPTEFGHILETFIRIAIPHPNIHFTLKHNQKLVHDLPLEKDGILRIGKLFGDEIASNLIYVESLRDEISVSGYVGHPKISRSNNRMQYFFLNGRFIRDRALQHALTEAFRGILTVGRFPIAFLKIEMPPDLFDVNVHPTKMEVRFLDSSKIYGHFLGAIREKFLSTDLNSHITVSDIPGKAANNSAKLDSNDDFRAFLSDTDPRKAIDDATADEHRRKIVDWAKEQLLNKDLSSENQTVPQNKTEFDINRAFEESFARESQHEDKPKNVPSVPLPTEPLVLHRVERKTPKSTYEKPFTPPHVEQQIPQYSPVVKDETQFIPKMEAIQIHDRYLVMETETGLAIIDQHALHERILYEKLKQRYETGKVDSQRLLVPVPIDLAPTESVCVKENAELLSQLGLCIEPFGGDTILITGYPAILEKVDPQDLLLGLIDTLLDSSKKPSRTDMLDEMLHQMSCKAAVKAGDKLRPDAVRRLLELAYDEINAHHCPHGRPSMLMFTCAELNKMFKRS